MGDNQVIEVSEDMQKWLRLLRDPAALIAPDDTMVAWNSAFASEINTVELKAGMPLPLEGNSIPATLTAAASGGIGMCHLMQDRAGTKSSWMMLCLSNPNSLRLVVLTQGEVSFAYNDEITQLPNRRDANERLLLEWGRLLRHENTEFSLAMVDIDHFKTINERYGHNTGDEALRHVGRLLKSLLRSGDWVARWGGEEFLIYLHNTNLEEASQIAERVRVSFAERPFTSSSGAAIPMTLCMGVSSSSIHLDSAKELENSLPELLHSLDVLLYDAKKAGRNRTISQQPGQRVFWDRASLDEIMAGGRLQATPSAINDDLTNTKVGSLWKLDIADACPNALVHARRSALQHNRSPHFDAACLSVVASLHDPAKHGEKAFLPISGPTLLQILHEKVFLDQAKAFCKDDRKLVLVLDTEHILLETNPEVLEILAGIDVQICMYANDAQVNASAFMSLLKSKYMLLGLPIEDKSPFLGINVNTVIISSAEVANKLRELYSGQVLAAAFDPVSH